MNFQPTVRPERTSWRDKAISERHRLYGWNAACVDLDLLLVEFESGSPSALVEYKAVGAKPVNLEHPTYRALRSLADCSRIPFLIAFYDNVNWTFVVTPANTFAHAYVSHTTTFSEREYVTLLYKMRSLEPDAEVLAALNSYKPVAYQMVNRSRLPPLPKKQSTAGHRRLPPCPPASKVEFNRRLYMEARNSAS